MGGGEILIVYICQKSVKQHAVTCLLSDQLKLVCNGIERTDNLR